MHNTCLDAIIKLYSARFRTELGVELKHIKVWTDNAPHQYRCRQNFIQVASISERHPGIKITHRLAVVDNFKGFHDSVGKDVAHLIRTLELKMVRSKNAYEVFVNCFKRLQQDVSDWQRCEREGDPQLKNKGTYGMDSRRVWFVVETQAELERLSLEYPGRILLCDRSFILDTHKKHHLKETTLLHEVRSVDTSVPTSHPRKWQVKTSVFPCNCVQCVVDPDNDKCSYSCWRNTRLEHMQIACVSPDEAESWVGLEISAIIAGQPRSGMIIQYKCASCTWLVRFSEDERKEYDYIEICTARDQFLAAQNNSSC